MRTMLIAIGLVSALGGSAFAAEPAKMVDTKMGKALADEKGMILYTFDKDAKGKSNCPHCAIGDNANKKRIYDLDGMDADHVSAWSKGGETSAKNCEMLSVTHNRVKGNR